MYELLVGQLDRQDVDEISDIILDPPADHKYEALKTRLIQVYGETEQRQVQRLLSEMELGDMKPSQLLRRMKNLARTDISDSTLRIMWANHLPQSVRAVLTVSETIMKTSDLSELSLVADKIHEQSRAEVSAVSAYTPLVAPTSSSSQHTNDSILHQKIDALTREVEELRLKQHKPFNRRWRTRSRGRSPAPHAARRSSSPRAVSPRVDSPRVCYYHRRFGRDAIKCTKPCGYEDSESGN